MIAFKQYDKDDALFEEVDSLYEMFDTKVEHGRNHALEHLVNHQAGDKIYPSHTYAYQSEHMTKNGHALIRVKNRQTNDVEYHIHNGNVKPGDKKGKADIDHKVLTHTLTLAKHYINRDLEKHRPVVIQSATEKQHHTYKKFADRLIQNHKHKSVRDVGKTSRTDGQGESHTLRLEEYIPIQKNTFNMKYGDFSE